MVIYINGLQLGEGVRKENLVMDGRLTTHVVQGERNWYALWLCGAVGRVMSVIVFPLICIYMQKGVTAHWIYQMCQWFVLVRLLSFQGLISYSGWSRIWISKIKVTELTQSNTWSWTEVFHPCSERHEAANTAGHLNTKLDISQERNSTKKSGLDFKLFSNWTVNNIISWLLLPACREI